MTRQDAMIQAIKETREFCDKYDVAPYGDTYSAFRQKTVELFLIRFIKILKKMN